MLLVHKLHSEQQDLWDLNNLVLYIRLILSGAKLKLSLVWLKTPSPYLTCVLAPEGLAVLTQ